MSEQESRENTQDDAPEGGEGDEQQDAGDTSAEEFVEDMESDPSRAGGGKDDGLDRLRGG